MDKSIHPARAEPSALTEARIERIADLMRRLEFRTGETARELAVTWGLSVDRVRDIASMASKRVRAELTDPDRVVVKVASTLETVIEDAMRETREPALIDGGERGVYKESPNGARRVVVEAAKTLAILTGANAPTKIETKASPWPAGVPTFDRAADALEWVRAELIPQLEARAAQEATAARTEGGE